MPTPLHREIRWFEAEVALCEVAIAETEQDESHASDEREKVLPGMRAALESCRKTLVELQEQLDRGVTH